ncbi:MAG: site-2 protease family protein [Oscillochloridaceae bacterium umkhey_bin13]
MSRLFTIGHIATIPIRLHWSWLLIFALLVVGLSPAYGMVVCGESGPCWASASLAALMAALIGLSVLLHELGHALVAARLAVPVHSITLFAFGGVAEVERESPSPGVDLAIAVAGPAVSLLIALFAGSFWWSRGGLAAELDALTVVAAHLAVANLMMGLFNLLPGYPMDGGRVLRATLWFLGDDRFPATQTAAYVGQLCGFAIAFGGLALALGVGQPLAALWPALIGLFLYRTAKASLRGLRLQMALHGVKVGDLMQRQPLQVRADLTLEQFVASHVLGQAETSFVVVADDTNAMPTVLGLMTLRDLRRFTTAQWSERRVAEAMTPHSQVALLTAQTPALDALVALNASPEGLLPVTDGPHLIGLLRRRDVAVYVQVQLARGRSG